MKNYAVIGLGFGDEGKGMFTDLLSSRLDNPVIVRFSGGQQAGHTVYLDEEVSHVFSNFGSGSFRGIPAFWSRHCTVDPVGMLNELHVLSTKGVSPVLYIDPRCPVTTPFEIHHNRRIEAEKQHGSCGVGVGATWEREANHYSLTYGDLFYPSVLKIKIDQIQKYYGESLFLNDFFRAVHILTNHGRIRAAHESLLNKFNSVVFEGSQGLLLDQNYGFFPHVTRSNTGTQNILAMGYEPFVFLVTRAYQTRHGKGPMTNENIIHSIKTNTQEKNEEPSFQGELRKSILDLDLLQYAINKDPYIRETSRKSLVITCLDLLEDYRYTLKEKVHRCADTKQFVEEIQTILGIDEAFGTASPLPESNKNILQRITEMNKAQKE